MDDLQENDDENEINGYQLVPGADLRGAFLAGIGFTGNLSGANLRGALLFSSNLNGINLEGANLEDANLQGVYLERANLQGANLTNVNLTGAHLNGINLRDAILNGARLDGAHFVDNDLRGANLEGFVRPLSYLDRFPPVVRAPPEAVAFEVHNYFDTLNIDEITRFLQEFNIGNAVFNQRTIPTAAAASSEQTQNKHYLLLF
jgi:uncharacterized protein YjbI with pentapeptide repeats